MSETRTMMKAATLAAHLRDMANRVELGDSFEGSIEYSCMNPETPVGEFAITGAYRIGNREGQGGMCVLGVPMSEPPPQRTESEQEDDKRELDVLYAWAALHPDPQQGWTQIVGFVPLLGYGCVLTHRMHSIVTNPQFRNIAVEHRKASGQRVELREYRFLRTLEELP